MDTETYSEIQAYVIQKLAESQSIDQIVYTLCEKYRLPWNDAAALVRNIQDRDAHLIAKKKAPWLVLLAIVTLAGGLASTGYALYILVGIGSAYAKLDTPMSIVGFLALNTNRVIQLGFAIVTGVGMIGGSMVGAKDIWSTVLTELENIFRS